MRVTAFGWCLLGLLAVTAVLAVVAPSASVAPAIVAAVLVLFAPVERDRVRLAGRIRPDLQPQEDQVEAHWTAEIVRRRVAGSWARDA